jgi:hypothetical protein
MGVTPASRTIAKKRKLTISLLVITFAFIILTLPSTIARGFLSNWMYATLPWANMTLDVLDYFSFLNHASVSFNCFLTNYKFRNVVIWCLQNKQDPAWTVRVHQSSCPIQGFPATWYHSSS